MSENPGKFEEKKIKVMLMRQHPKNDDLSVVFTVKHNKRKEFQAVLNNFLDFSKAHAKIDVETIDSLDSNSTHLAIIRLKPISMNTAELFDPRMTVQGLLVDELRNRIPQFQDSCSSIQ